VEVDPVCAERAQLANDARWRDRGANRIAEWIAADVADGPQAEGEMMLGARGVGVRRGRAGHLDYPKNGGSKTSHPEEARAERRATEGSLSTQGFTALARKQSLGRRSLRSGSLRMTRVGRH